MSAVPRQLKSSAPMPMRMKHGYISMALLTAIAGHNHIVGSIGHILEGVPTHAALASGCLKDQHAHFPQTIVEPSTALFINSGHNTINQVRRQFASGTFHSSVPGELLPA